jgi:hypothetical protein
VIEKKIEVCIGTSRAKDVRARLSRTNGTVHLKADDPNGLSPHFVMSGLHDVANNIDGVPTPTGPVPGFGIIQEGSNPNAPMFIIIANRGAGTAPDARSVLIRIYGQQSRPQGCDQGIEFLTASGTFDQPTAVHAGDRLGKVVGMGHNGNGYYPNESAGIGFWADQDFAPNGPTIRAGGSVGFTTCDENTNNEVFRGHFDSRGNFFLGNRLPFANAWPCKGGLILKECVQAPTGNANGSGILFVQNGALKFCGASGSITTLAPA